MTDVRKGPTRRELRAAVASDKRPFDIRLALRRVRSRAELDRLRARYAGFQAYFPPLRGVAASRGAA